MFDIAYLPEATIEAARMVKTKLWEKAIEQDLSKPFSAIGEIFEIDRCNNAIAYWNFIYYTHGGI